MTFTIILSSDLPYIVHTPIFSIQKIFNIYLPGCSWLVSPGPSIWSLLPFPLPRPLLVLSDLNFFPAPIVSFSGHVDALLGGIPVSRPGIVPLRI